jgi:hypothetical protein
MCPCFCVHAQGIPSLGELKLRYYQLMITYHQHYHSYLEICRCYKAIYESEGVQDDPAQWGSVSDSQQQQQHARHVSHDQCNHSNHYHHHHIHLQQQQAAVQTFWCSATAAATDQAGAGCIVLLLLVLRFQNIGYILWLMLSSGPLLCHNSLHAVS